MGGESLREISRRENALLRESARGGMLRRLGGAAQLNREDSTRDKGEDAWLMTYLDLITLLLVLFVLLLAYSERGSDAFAQITHAIGEATRHGDRLIQPIPMAPAPGQPIPQQLEQPGEPAPGSELERRSDAVLEGMQQDLLSQFAEAGMGAGIEVMLRQDQLDIQLSEQILFASGEARLRPEASRALSPIANVLRLQPYDLTVEGHTDNIPIATEMFPSNWELSASRASYVVRFLIQQGINAERLRAVGYADTRPIGDNLSPEGRAKNRRVTLIIHQQQQQDPP